MKKKTVKLINPKVIFILSILVFTCDRIFNMIDEPIISTNIVSFCFHLLVVFSLPISLILFLSLAGKESKNKAQFSLYDIGSFFLGFGSVLFLWNTMFLSRPFNQIAVLSVLVIVLILVVNSVQGGQKLL
jgi:hypothetical protein